MSDFVHLHLHTEYSLLDGINRVDTLPKYIDETLGQKAVAMTDHGTIAGAYRFVKACRKQGIKPIVGMEAYYAVGDRTVREADHLGQRYHHMVLLAMNNTGLHNLKKLTSESFTSGMYYKPRIDDSLIADYSEGIMATSACLGSYSSQLILNNQKDAAEKLLEHHAEMFKDRFFIELQLHEDKEQQDVNAALLEIAKKHDWPLLLTNDCHYTHQNDKQLHEAALCMQTGDTLDNPNRFSFGPIDVHVANHDWMWEHAQKYGIPYEAISNSAHIASMVQDETYYQDRKNRYPHFQGDTQGKKVWEWLEVVSQRGLAEKMGGSVPQSYRDRLDYELRIIKKMGFYHYLLIVQEIIEGARELEVAVGAGRGSAAGSLVAYALDITKVDPIKHGLVFERFLNPGRAATPLHFDLSLHEELKALDNDRIDSHDDHDHNHVHVPSPRQKERIVVQSLTLPTKLLTCLHHTHSAKI